MTCLRFKSQSGYMHMSVTISDFSLVRCLKWKGTLISGMNKLNGIICTATSNDEWRPLAHFVLLLLFGSQNLPTSAICHS